MDPRGCRLTSVTESEEIAHVVTDQGRAIGHLQHVDRPTDSRLHSLGHNASSRAQRSIIFCDLSE
jgi:hypothetical protein